LERREERLVDLATETGGVRAIARRPEKLEEERREIMALSPEPERPDPANLRARVEAKAGEIREVFSISLAFGVLFATLITLLVVPAGDLILEDLRLLRREPEREVEAIAA